MERCRQCRTAGAAESETWEGKDDVESRAYLKHESFFSHLASFPTLLVKPGTTLLAENEVSAASQASVLMKMSPSGGGAEISECYDKGKNKVKRT